MVTVLSAERAFQKLHQLVLSEPLLVHFGSLAAGLVEQAGALAEGAIPVRALEAREAYRVGIPNR